MATKTPSWAVSGWMIYWSNWLVYTWRRYRPYVGQSNFESFGNFSVEKQVLTDLDNSNKQKSINKKTMLETLCDLAVASVQC